jgi:DNA-binding transcriptional LysR family regulator
VARAETAERAALSVWAESRAPLMVGTVRLATIDILASAWIAPQLPRLFHKHPGISLELLTDVRQMDLSRGEAELAIRQPRPRQRELTATRLGVGTMALFGRPALRKRLGQPRLPLFVYPDSLDFLQQAKWFRALAATAEIRLTTNNTSTLLAAALTGEGAAVLPRWLASREPALVDLGGRDLSRNEMWLVSHPEFRRDARVQAVAAFLRTAARGPEGIF